MRSIAYVGLDVHKRSISVAVIPPLLDARAVEVREPLGLAYDRNAVLEERTLPNDKGKLEGYFARLRRQYELQCCYEASGCGYVLHRWLREMGIDCVVIAPSKTPRASGDRVGTDRLDALKLARSHRAGDLVAVHVPTLEEEGVRAFVRHRETLVGDVTRQKNRVLKFVDRHGILYQETKNNFTQAHWRFLRGLQFRGEEGYAFEDMLAQLQHLQSRLEEADRRLETLAASDTYAELVGKIACLRGLAKTSAMVLIAETCDFKRFGKAHELMGYYGFGVCEDSSGERRWQGGITKTGNPHCRRVLVEAAWHYKHRPTVGVVLKRRHEGQPPDVVAHAIKAQHRLHDRFYRVLANTKDERKAVVAVARELAGFVWAIGADRCGPGHTGAA